MHVRREIWLLAVMRNIHKELVCSKLTTAPRAVLAVLSGAHLQVCSAYDWRVLEWTVWITISHRLFLSLSETVFTVLAKPRTVALKISRSNFPSILF